MSTSSMSTPINQLPQNKPTSATIPNDPEVLNVLSEMEQEVQSAARANSLPIPAPAPAPAPAPTPTPMPTAPMTMMMSPPNVQIRRTTVSHKWLNTDVMQRAGIIAAIALVIFYPKTMEYIYTVPKLAFLEQYDIIVRALTLGIAVYFLTIQFGM